MNWDDLRFVLALSRHRSHNQAAAHLKATHTTVGRRLRALEATLGTRLFDRTADGYVATAAGAEVAASAERVEAELLALEARVLGGDTRLQGKLRVSTMDILFRRYHSAFRSFTERHPGVELTVVCNDAEASLTRREADVALRMTRSPPGELIGRKVGRVEFAVYGQRELVRRLRRQRAKGGYAAFPWLHWDERLDPRWLDAWLAGRAPGARVALRVDMSSLALREAIAGGLGVHFLATFEGDSDERLARLGPVESDYSRDVWLLTLPELRGTTRVRALLDHLEEAVRGAEGRRRGQVEPKLTG